MTPNELQSILIASGFSCKIRGEEVVLETCYFCGNSKFNLELNADRGVFHCWACKQGGTVNRILRQLTGQDHRITVDLQKKQQSKPNQPTTAAQFGSRPASQILSAKNYLAARGIDTRTADQYNLQVCMEEGHQLYGRICIPVYEYWTDVLLGWSGRSYTNKYPKYIHTLERRLIAGLKVRQPDQHVVAVEGGFDGIAVHQAGFNTAVFSGIGSAGVLEWADRFLRRSATAKIVLMLDAEAAESMRRLYWQLQVVAGTRVVVTDWSKIQTDGRKMDPSQIGATGVRALVHEAIA